MKTITLSTGQVTRVSDEDYDTLNAFKWFLKDGYVARSAGPRGRQKTVFMHRIVMGEPMDFIVDHRDQDPLNNQRDNLRLCSRQQNNQNRKKYGAGMSSKYKGVSWRKVEGKWQAKIRHNNKQKHLGLFKTEDEAAIAYNEAAKKIQGEFACLNQIMTAVKSLHLF